MRITSRVVFSGADVITLSDALPRAEAVSVTGGRIEAVGSREEILAYAKPGGYELVELSGGFLYPGFIDTHSHLSLYSACIDRLLCGETYASAAEVCDALRFRAASSDREWILGYGFDDTGTAEKRHLTRQDLDMVCADRPVFVTHISLHLAYANTLALEKLGLSAKSRIPGGEVVLDGEGLPTGLLVENAAFHAFSRLPASTSAELAGKIETAIAEYNRQGFTSFMDGGIGLGGDPEPVIRAYASLAREGRMNARAYLQLLPDVMDRLHPFGLSHVYGDYLSLGGVKYFADGSIQAFTAALREDYHTRPGFRGELLFPEEKIEADIARFHAQNMQVAVHTNGDRATEAVLSAFEKAMIAHPRTNPRHMMVHAQLASDDQLRRMKARGILPTFFPRHIEVWGDRHARVFLGQERAARLNPAASCVRMGMPFALHSDTPVLPITALGCMRAAVNRVSAQGVLYGPEQRISPLDALKAYTTHAALCCFAERDRGRIEPGFHADFVLLSEDLERSAPEAINDVRVRMTICGGRIVFQE